METVYVILVNYRNSQLTLDCIDSIKKSLYKNIEIVVVDNKSEDRSAEVLRKVIGIHLIEAVKNGGFSYGNNLGIEYAIQQNADYILLLNNDTVIAPEMIGMLVSNSGKKKVTVPKIYYYEKEGRKDYLWYAGGELDLKKCDGSHIGLGQKDAEKFSMQKQVTYATGCCILIPTKVLKTIGLLDEEFFMYCEDTDFSIRLLHNGIEIEYVPGAKLWHKVSATSGGEMSRFVVYYVVRNRIYCARKNKLGLRTIVYIHLETINRIVKGLLGVYYKTYSVALFSLIDADLNRMGKNERRYLRKQ